ncbi:MAG TPA: hypothetical protein VD735_05535 [Candidatus Saccharimonadales bacterium]|nr:hypothetical protein [Candidatus Saccharimonadales bacterium]
MSNPAHEGAAPIQSPEDFMERYGEVDVTVPGIGIVAPLTEVVAMEERFCPADTADRQDPFKRVGYLANLVLYTGQLNPAHHHLAPDTWNQAS